MKKFCRYFCIAGLFCSLLIAQRAVAEEAPSEEAAAKALEDSGLSWSLKESRTVSTYLEAPDFVQYDFQDQDAPSVYHSMIWQSYEEVRYLSLNVLVPFEPDSENFSKDYWQRVFQFACTLYDWPQDPAHLLDHFLEAETAGEGETWTETLKEVTAAVKLSPFQESSRLTLYLYNSPWQNPFPREHSTGHYSDPEPEITVKNCSREDFLNDLERYYGKAPENLLFQKQEPSSTGLEDDGSLDYYKISVSDTGYSDKYPIHCFGYLLLREDGENSGSPYFIWQGDSRSETEASHYLLLPTLYGGITDDTGNVTFHISRVFDREKGETVGSEQFDYHLKFQFDVRNPHNIQILDPECPG